MTVTMKSVMKMGLSYKHSTYRESICEVYEIYSVLLRRSWVQILALTDQLS
jgi:hypothetical protein